MLKKLLRTLGLIKAEIETEPVVEETASDGLDKETIIKAVQHLKEKGYTFYPPMDEPPMAIWVRKASEQKPFTKVPNDRLGDINALRDVGRAFQTLVPAVMETGMTLIEGGMFGEDEAEIKLHMAAFEDVNTAVVAIYNNAVNNIKNIADLLSQLNTRACVEPELGRAYSLYCFLFLQNFIAYNLVAFPVLFGLAEYDPNAMASYSSSLVTMGFVEDRRLRKRLSKVFADIGTIPASVPRSALIQASDNLMALVVQEAEYRKEKEKKENTLED